MIQPARLQLKAVTNHGREYPGPAEHKGMPINGTNLPNLTSLGLRFYAETLQLIERKFVG